MQTFSTKRVAEDFPIGIGFSKPLASLAEVLGAAQTIASIVSVAVYVISGTDSNPGAIRVDAPSLNGAVVIQRIRGGVSGVRYALVAKVLTTSGYTLEGEVMLPVKD